jgi:hypothetical protein
VIPFKHKSADIMKRKCKIKEFHNFTKKNI